MAEKLHAIRLKVAILHSFRIRRRESNLESEDQDPSLNDSEFFFVGGGVDTPMLYYIWTLVMYMNCPKLHFKGESFPKPREGGAAKPTLAYGPLGRDPRPPKIQRV